MKAMKIGIVGHLGVVGGAVKHGLARLGHEVIGHDTAAPGSSLDALIDTHVIFVCVPTPSRGDGSCDVSIVEDVVGTLSHRHYGGLVAIKSTVPPGTTARLRDEHSHGRGNYAGLRLAFCPEFLRERAAVVDFYEHHDVCIAGVRLPDVHDDADLLRRVHGPLPKHFAVMTPTEAELAKYFSNVFNALRIVFANEFFEVCKAMGASYDTIKAAMVKRTTIEDVYLDCNAQFRGFAGMCLPKDTAAFAAHVRSLGLDLALFQTIVDENRRFAPTVPDGMRP